MISCSPSPRIAERLARFLSAIRHSSCDCAACTELGVLCVLCVYGQDEINNSEKTTENDRVLQ
jgi:hypothetical protein